ncbi:MAG: hypothetical protein KUL74_04760 [Cloacibacterium sp.]|nr:hypothetical protein [Cloacibacterium sp.]
MNDQKPNLKRIIFLLLIFVFYLFSCDKAKQNDYDNISFKVYKGEDCKDCQGKLVVVKGKQIDTIQGGQWGQNLNYKTFKIKNKNYLFTNFTYSYQMGTRLKEYKIFSLDDSQYLKKIFEKVIVEYEERNMKENGVYMNYIMNRDVKVSLKDSIGFIVKMKIEKCPEIENTPCIEIFNDTSLEYYKY